MLKIMELTSPLLDSPNSKTRRTFFWRERVNNLVNKNSVKGSKLTRDPKKKKNEKVLGHKGFFLYLIKTKYIFSMIFILHEIM